MNETQLHQHIDKWKHEQQLQSRFSELDEKRIKVAKWKVATNQPLNLFDFGIIPTKRLKVLFEGKPVKRIFLKAGHLEIVR